MPGQVLLNEVPVRVSGCVIHCKTKPAQRHLTLQYYFKIEKSKFILKIARA